MSDPEVKADLADTSGDFRTQGTTAQMKPMSYYRKACRLGLPGWLEDQVCDRVGLRYQGKVTRLDFDRLGACAYRKFDSA